MLQVPEGLPRSNLGKNGETPSFVPIGLEGKRKNRDGSSNVPTRDVASSYNHEILQSLIKIYILHVQKCA